MKWPSLRAIVKAYAMSLAFWFAISLLEGWQDRILTQHPWSSFLESLAIDLTRAIAWAVWTPPIFYFVSKYLSLPSRPVSRPVVIFVCGLIPFLIFSTAFDWALFPPYDDQLQKSVPRSFHLYLEMAQTGFANRIWTYVSILVAAHAYEYFKRVRRQERERSEYQQALAASELQALKMQLHPHFLFNTLNGIATLVSDDPDRAKTMIVKLSSLLRTALDRGSSDLIPLHEELKFVGDYLDIEKMRLGDRLRIEWRVGSDTRSLLVPQMILQPLVENAIRHGVTPSRDNGWVEVLTSVSHGALKIQVRNSGSSVGGGKRSDGTGVGLLNVKSRLKHLYAGEAELCFAIAGDRTAIAELTLPALDSLLKHQEADVAHTEIAETKGICESSSSTTSL